MIRYNTIDESQHYLDCRAEDCNYYELHDTTVSFVNDGLHKFDCNVCNYSVYKEHELYIFYLDDEGCDVRCRSCSYMITCYELPIYSITDTVGHTVSCPGGCYSFYEEHDYNYMFLLPNDGDRLVTHKAICSVCTGTYYLPHNWVTVADGSVECSDCGLVSDIGGIGGIQSLSDEELELYLASLSDEELKALLASLPEADLARVTALLPPDDDELVTE